MHELSIALAIVDAAVEESERRGGVRVTKVHLKLGQLAGVAKSALLASYEMAAEQSSVCRLEAGDRRGARSCLLPGVPGFSAGGLHDGDPL